MRARKGRPRLDARKHAPKNVMQAELVTLVGLKLAPNTEARDIEAFLDVVVPDCPGAGHRNDPKATTFVTPGIQGPFLWLDSYDVVKTMRFFFTLQQRAVNEAIEFFAGNWLPLFHAVS